MSAMPVRAPRRQRVQDVPLTTERPKLRVVQAPTTHRQGAGVWVVSFSVVVGSFLLALLLNTVMATTAYQISDQQTELARLRETEQQLTQEINTLRSPQALTESAHSLGMVPTEGVNYLNLEDGTIVGPTVPGQE